MNFTFDEKDAKAIVDWLAGIDSEITYWSNWFEIKGRYLPEDYFKRTEGKVEFAYPDIIAGKARVKVLDVGAGPISCLGNIAEGTIIELSACDPLAFVYKELLDKACIKPYVLSEFAMTERLCDAYHKDSFDIVNMTNALDHSINPLLGVYNMLAVCKQGGSVVLYHKENEAEFGHYDGLHKWNICEESGDLIFWNKSQRINVTGILGENAKIEVSRTNFSSKKLDMCITRHYVKAVITKKGDCAFSTAGLNIYDKILTQIAFYGMSFKYREIAPNDMVLEKLKALSKNRLTERFIRKLKSIVWRHRDKPGVERLIEKLRPIIKKISRKNY